MSKRQSTPNLVGFLNGRVEDLRRLVPRALRSWDREAIHHSRVATRRLKSALNLLEPIVAADTTSEFAAVLRKLRRALGPLRDVDVMSIHLEEFRRNERLAPAARWLMRVLQERRAKLQRKAARKAPVQAILKGLGAWWAIEQELSEAEQAESSLVRRTIPRQLESFAKRADRLARVRTHDATAAHEDVHALRIDGKVLRYTLELATPIGFDIPAPLFRSFKKLQDTLGMWHDYVVLGEQSVQAAIDHELPLHDPHLYGLVLLMIQRCWKQSEMQLDRFSRTWIKSAPSMLSAIRSAIHCAEPETSSASVDSENGHATAEAQT
jgi:CHAD domain-containing protein